MRLPIATALIFLGCLFSGAPTDVSTPSAQGLRKLYGEPTMERFAVRSGITLTVEYGADRTACQLLIAPTQVLADVQEPVPPNMSSRGVSDVLEELVPAATGGKQTNSTTIQIGGNALLQTDYENLFIRRICSSQPCAFSDENQDVRTLVIFKRVSCPEHVK